MCIYILLCLDNICQGLKLVLNKQLLVLGVPLSSVSEENHVHYPLPIYDSQTWSFIRGLSVKHSAGYLGGKSYIVRNMYFSECQLQIIDDCQTAPRLK